MYTDELPIGLRFIMTLYDLRGKYKGIQNDRLFDLFKIRSRVHTYNHIHFWSYICIRTNVLIEQSLSLSAAILCMFIFWLSMLVEHLLYNIIAAKRSHCITKFHKSINSFPKGIMNVKPHLYP